MSPQGRGVGKADLDHAGRAEDPPARERRARSERRAAEPAIFSSVRRPSPRSVLKTRWNFSVRFSNTESSDEALVSQTLRLRSASDPF